MDRMHRRKSFLMAGIFAITLAGCASMTSSKEALQSIGEDEGVVVGSFVITIEKGDETESEQAYLMGQKTRDAAYTVYFSEKGFNLFGTSYMIRAQPEQEVVFIKKLPVGEYEIQKISKAGFTTLEVNVRNLTFRVVPRQTTYVGKITMQFPNRIKAGSPVQMIVGDARQETTELLKGEYGPSLSRIVTTLMTGGETSEGIPDVAHEPNALENMK